MYGHRRTAAQPNISWWGDSQVNTLNDLAGGFNSVVDHLRRITRRRVYQGGVGGEPAESTYGRFVAQPAEQLNDTIIITTGHNNYSYPYMHNEDVVKIESYMQAIIDLIPHNRWIMTTMSNGTPTSLDTYWTLNIQRHHVNDYWIQKYGVHCVDVFAAQRAYDLKDTHAQVNNIMPLMLTQLPAPSHPNALGTLVSAHAVARRLQEQGW
jgi:hypothetical protein